METYLSYAWNLSLLAPQVLVPLSSKKRLSRRRKKRATTREKVQLCSPAQQRMLGSAPTLQVFGRHIATSWGLHVLRQQIAHGSLRALAHRGDWVYEALPLLLLQQQWHSETPHKALDRILPAKARTRRRSNYSGTSAVKQQKKQILSLEMIAKTVLFTPSLMLATL